MKVKKAKKRCRHRYGPWCHPSDEPVPYQSCIECGRVRFHGERGIDAYGLTSTSAYPYADWIK